MNLKLMDFLSITITSRAIQFRGVQTIQLSNLKINRVIMMVYTICYLLIRLDTMFPFKATVQKLISQEYIHYWETRYYNREY